MSTELTNARKKLNTVSTLLKKGKYMPAVQAVHDSLILILKSQLMKAERQEFEDMLRKTTYDLNSDPNLRKINPLVISYEPGEEKKLLQSMRDLLAELQRVVTDKAQGDLAAIQAQRTTMIQQAQTYLDAKNFSQAKTVFDQVLADFGGDTDLKAEIADRYLKAEQYEHAYHLLEDALADDPDAIHLYNRIGIVLRKMKDFDTAEQYYLKALTLTAKDEFLHFNLGHLYYDWHKWDKMATAAKAALEINPSFSEANKMLMFASKKMGK